MIPVLSPERLHIARIWLAAHPAELPQPGGALSRGLFARCLDLSFPRVANLSMFVSCDRRNSRKETPLFLQVWPTLSRLPEGCVRLGLLEGGERWVPTSSVPVCDEISLRRASKKCFKHLIRDRHESILQQRMERMRTEWEERAAHRRRAVTLSAALPCRECKRPEQQITERNQRVPPSGAPGVATFVKNLRSIGKRSNLSTVESTALQQ